MGVLATVVAMEAWVMAVAMADMFMTAVTHISDGDTGPTDSTE